jgi:hypothetical protein
MDHAEIVQRFNRRFPVGHPVTVRNDDGTLHGGHVCASARLSSCAAPIVWVSGFRGSCRLDRIVEADLMESDPA